MTEWPPRSVKELRQWLRDEVSLVQERADILAERIARFEELSRQAAEQIVAEFPQLKERYDALAQSIENAEAMAHQPVNAHYSQVNVARTMHSDPTYSVVLTWLVKLPWLREQMRDLLTQLEVEVLAKLEDLRAEQMVVGTVLGEYEQSKRALTERQRKIIEGHYEVHLSRAEIAKSLSISTSTYDEDLKIALRRMFAVVGWVHDIAPEKSV